MNILNGQITQQNLQMKQLDRDKEGLRAIIASMHVDKEALHVDMQAGHDYMADVEEKLYQSNLRNLELLRRLKQDETEIAGLKSYILELKARVAIYVPVKEDPLDVKMADYINNYPDRTKLKIMFMRESAGVYAFGTKRINVEVMQDRIKVRIGGGYLSIDEFID